MNQSLLSLRAALAGQYRVERELGAGGMATVYLAHDVKHDRAVAIKVLKPELAASIGADRFLKEIRVTANLQHPHIVPLYDSGQVGSALYYVMPHLTGESLEDRLARESILPVDEAVRIARQIAGALDFAHRHGVVHRDIKPANILLQDGEVLVADFGIALGVRETDAARLTGTGLSLGTPRYMSPEQAVGEREVDARSDIYSLGALTYEMLAGEPPVTGANAQAMIAKLMTGKPTPLRVVRATVPPAVDAAVMRALAKQPADRFASAREFSDALTLPVSVRRPRVRTLLVGVAVVAGIVVAARALMPRTAEARPIQSIAVLPLENASRDSAQDYFAEGMTDELTASLATISTLRVTSRGSAMSFTEKNRPSNDSIARMLNVDAILEGRVQRSGDIVRIAPHLIDVRPGQNNRELALKQFVGSSSDVLALQAQLAQAIAHEIKVQISSVDSARLGAVAAVNPESHEHYLKGRYFFNRPSDDNLQKAIAQFDSAVRLSPTSAAYSGLSDAYLWAGYNEGRMSATEARPLAKKAAEMAVQLDPSSAEAHTSLATFKLFYEFDWPGCEVEFRRAIELNPNYGFAHDQFGMALGFQGRFDESIAQGKRAIALDPLSPQVLIDATMPFMFKRDYAQARRLANAAHELDPTFFFPVMLDGWVSLEEGKAADAIPSLARAATMDAPPFTRAYLALAYGRAGNKAAARAQFDTLALLDRGRKVLPFNRALVDLGIGDTKQALTNLEAALAADSQMMAWIGQDHIFDSLRSEPRFIALLKRINFAK
jgi:serine/threonine protein kinase/tetratricopeptide (TPR) repeat protein